MAPENATGYFTKIDQRIPVKIVFAINNAHETLLNTLRVGMVGRRQPQYAGRLENYPTVSSAKCGSVKRHQHFRRSRDRTDWHAAASRTQPPGELIGQGFAAFRIGDTAQFYEGVIKA